MTSINDASKAYMNTLTQAAGGAKNAPSGPSFGDILKESLGSAIEAQHKSEAVSADALIGKANMTDVLQAVNNAEVALNTVLAIRDKVIQAYEDVMRTSI